MGQKLTKKNDCEHKIDKGEKKNEASSSTPTTVILKVDMHCDGCASKIVKCFCGVEALRLNLLIEGVQSLKSKIETEKLIMTKNGISAKLKDNITRKMKKNVNIDPPLPNKDNENQAKNNEKKSKDKEASMVTVILKVSSLCPCQGCDNRIRKAVLKTKGVHNVGIDKEKGILTVKGTMDVTALTRKLSQKFKRNIEAVIPKKEKEKGKEKGKGNEKENDKKGNDTIKKKKKNDNNSNEGYNDKDNKAGANGKEKTKQNTVNYIVPTYGYGYDNNYSNSSNYMGQYHIVSQMFNDENPYACQIM